MLINLFLKKPLQYKQIEKYQYGALFGVASYSLYSIAYVNDFHFITNLMFWFLTSETFFLPYNRIDSFIHHLLSVIFIYYPTIYSIPISQIQPHYITFLKVETSSIFLSTSYFLILKINIILLNICSLFKIAEIYLVIVLKAICNIFENQ